VSLCDGLRGDLEQENLAKLGCSILANNSSLALGSGTAIWSRLLPQLSHSIPSVNAAAAALGAAYEASYLTYLSTSARTRRPARQYGIALRSLQRDVASRLYGPVPVLLSCALLACVELLRRRQYNALMHLEGAFKLLHERDQLQHHLENGKVHSTNVAESYSTGHSALEDDLSLMFKTLDIQKASYTLGQPPVLPPSNISSFDHTFPSSFPTSYEAESHIIRLIHSTYHFTSRASHFKCLPRHSVDPLLPLEQGRRIARLSLFLQILNRDLICPPSRPNSEHIHYPPEKGRDAHHHTLLLRTQLLSTLIYASTILCADEKSYDAHAPHFQQIISDAGTILDMQTPSQVPKSNAEPHPQLNHFKISPGLTQPLLLTALKYRHSTHRRRAIELLRRCGREGPFDGTLLAAVARRAVQIEENSSVACSGGEILPEHIQRRWRLHGCGVDAEAKDDAAEMREVGVMFSRCVDVEGMLDSKERAWDDQGNWEIWDEVVPF
jgi:hypothetical protein